MAAVKSVWSTTMLPVLIEPKADFKANWLEKALAEEDERDETHLERIELPE